MITSYAQNLEDVVLFRAFENLETGFYIDIGANDPVTDSVTKLFYDNGWRGINIEPAKNWFDKLKADRSRDICLNIAISDEIGAAPFHDIESSGLSTLLGDVAERHDSLGLARAVYDVQTQTLARICEQHAAETIHFLKIDVEGAEEKVLRGADFARFRPWVVLVEATEPLSNQLSHFGWDPILIGADYEFVLFDGLNRFYVAEEKAELKPCFAMKGDAYRTIESIWTLGYWQRIAAEREAEIERLREQANAAQVELSKIKATRLWRAREKLLGGVGKAS